MCHLLAKVIAAALALANHNQHFASIASTVEHVLAATGQFFSQIASLNLGALVLGLAFYALYLLLRSRALLNALRAAYPGVPIRWRDVWGAYTVSYAINNVFPLGGGNVAQLFLTRVSIPPSSYPAVASALSTGVIFDWFMGVLVMCFAFTQGVFPKPPDLSRLAAFHISFFASHMRFTLFCLTCLGIAFVVAFALLSAWVRAVWQEVRQGLTILRDRRRYRNEMASWQFASWIARFASYWVLLDAFHIGRVGPNRSARARRAGGRLGVPVHARRLGRPAGPADHDLRPQPRCRRVLSWSADRHRRAHHRPGVRFAGGDLPVQEFRRGDRPRQGTSSWRGAGRRGGRRTRGALTPRQGC